MNQAQISIRRPERGFSFVEMLITAAIIVVVFGGLFAGVRLMVTVIGDSKAKTGATALAVERLEYLRSLTYNELGTEGGIPGGAIPQQRTVFLNDLAYTERIIVEYVDDPADGFGSADGNGILSDYKRLKVEYSWLNEGATTSVAVVSTVVPPGVETTAGGGSIRVNVFDATTAPVSGATVRFRNDTTTPTIDTTRLTDPDGQVLLSGAPAAANYEIMVMRTGYSTDGTYQASSTNPNPITPPLAVVESAVSTMNFQIDELADATIRTVGVPMFGSFVDDFTDDSLISSYASTTRSGGAIQLVGGSGSYPPSGMVIATTTSPSPLKRWYTATWTDSTSTSTSLAVSVYYDDGGSMALIPDADLPGNSSGFTTSPIALEALPVGTYDTLALGATLATADPSQTPELFDWQLTYVATEPNLDGISLSVRGNKIIGTGDGSQPIYKFARTETTDSNGVVSLPQIEFDDYTIELLTTAYDLYEVCPNIPFSLLPAADETVTLTLGNAVSAMLRVAVADVGNTPIPEATVRLQNIGVDETLATSLCGQATFVSGLYQADDYTLVVSAPGYETSTSTNVSVTSSSTVSVILNE